MDGEEKPHPLNTNSCPILLLKLRKPQVEIVFMVSQAKHGADH